MKVLYFHQYFSTPSGSSGTRSYEMAKNLILRGHEVIMVCGSGQLADTGLKKDRKKGMRRGIVEGIDVIELDLPYSNYYSIIHRGWIFLIFALKSIYLAMFLKYDLVFATSTPLTAGIPGIIASILRSKPFVFEVRDLWPELPKEMGVIKNPVVITLLSVLEWITYHTAKGCVGLSPGIVQGIKKRGIKSERVIMVPNACDLELFEKKSGNSRRPVGVKKEEFLALFAGAHGIANGLDSVVDAALILKKNGIKDIKILFIGDGKKKPELVNRCEKEDLDNCIFIEPVKKNILSEYMRGADAGLMVLANIPAFYYGTSPNKFFDYISSGLPVINNYPGWLAEMINKYKCGIAVKPDNPELLAEALEIMAKNRDNTIKMGENSRKLAEEKFSRKVTADLLVDYLENIIK